MSDLDIAEQGENRVDEILHYGVKGMRWGQRKSRPTSDEIRSARGRNFARGAAETSARIDRYAAKGTSEKAAAVKKHQKLRAAYLNHPDRATALRLTRGEKFTLAALAVAFPGVGTVGAGSYATSSIIQRKAVERSQRKAKANG